LATGGARFKYGCLGCLGLVALVLVVVLVVSVVAVVTARPEQVEDRVLIPASPDEVSGDSLRGVRIALEIREAELHVEPVDPGEPWRVEARYDVNAFSLEEELDAGTENDDAWGYRVRFGKGDLPGVFSGLVALARGSTARINVFLPTDVPIDLSLDMKEGGAVVRLAGLWLRTADVDFESGAFELSVDEPLREPMESLSIRVARGGALLNSLGNASPRHLDVAYNTSGIDMSLRGRWLRDAEINISGGMGGGVLHLPHGVIIEGLDRGGIDAPDPPEPMPPTLRFTLSTGMGKLELAE